MQPLSEDAAPLESRADPWDVVIVGSGYGASVMAARLAHAGLEVCVLERGKEHTQFPAQPNQLLAELQLSGARRHNRLGLYDVHVQRHLDVLVGCGLGGTSLINANVVIEPEARVFESTEWPA